MPHGHCYLWEPGLVALHVSSDALIGIAYLSISISLYLLLQKIKMPFSPIVLAFGVFIGACGMTHFIEIFTLWHPEYWISGWVKALTALASVYTAVALVRLAPRIFAFAESARKSEEHAKQLAAAHQMMEERIRERTQELEQSAKDFKELANSMPQIVWSAAPDGRLHYFNDVWFQYSGTTYDENVGDRWAHAVHPDDLAITIERWSQALSTQTVYENEFRLRNAKGEFRWHVVRAIPARNSDGTIKKWNGTNTDIHDTKMLTEAMNAAKKQAEEASLAKSTFLANMSHEIRTPLGAIIGFADLISRAGTSKEDIDGFVSIIQRNSSQLLRIIDDILDLSKVEAGKLEVEKIQFSLLETLSDLASLFGLKARENGVEFAMLASTPVPDLVISDSTRLRQILINIVGNAIKFTEKGSVLLTVSFENSMLRFVVKDTGRGIANDQIAKLFKSFSQADSATNRNFGGTGLGLVLTRSLCEAMDGEFYLQDSSIGRGSTFVACIRIQMTAEAVLTENLNVSFSATPAPGGAENSTLLQGMSVLLVEDSPDNQALIKILLQRSGVKVDLASNGIEGIETALAANYDAILMDVQMPKMDGYEATAKLRATNYTKPIIALTAHTMKAEREKALRSGFDFFLSKPLQRDSLIALLKSIYLNSKV